MESRPGSVWTLSPCDPGYNTADTRRGSVTSAQNLKFYWWHRWRTSHLTTQWGGGGRGLWTDESVWRGRRMLFSTTLTLQMAKESGGASYHTHTHTHIAAEQLPDGWHQHQPEHIQPCTHTPVLTSAARKKGINFQINENLISIKKRSWQKHWGIWTPPAPHPPSAIVWMTDEVRMM